MKACVGSLFKLRELLKLYVFLDVLIAFDDLANIPHFHEIHAKWLALRKCKILGRIKREKMQLRKLVTPDRSPYLVCRHNCTNVDVFRSPS